MPSTFYEGVARELGLEDANLDFPDLMTEFVKKRSRNELITSFVGRKRYIESFPDLLRRATRFHRAVGQIPFFQEIVTTNWDDYFERATGSVPLVYGADFDYWDLPQRKVIKVHGSMLNPGSIVATRTEYDASLEALRSGALGGTVRHLMATRSVVFIGYSLRDDDIRAVIDVLRADLATAARPCYFVHPSDAFEPPIPGSEVFHTSAAKFIELLDDALVEADYLLPLEMYDRLNSIEGMFRRARTRFDDRVFPWKYPLAILNHSYQDGFGDALDRVRAHRITGEHRRHHDLTHTARGYLEAVKIATKKKAYWDAAYMEGYALGLAALATNRWPMNRVPFYYCPGLGPSTSFSEIAKAVRAGAATHKPAFRWAAKETKELPEGMYFIHSPFLPSYG
ncbi:MAG: hypothetical protein QOK43_1331 [Acidimicrobiaceae bacterium]|nr:hypothetical protein [Acidimicrobiaceae bacterium]